MQRPGERGLNGRRRGRRGSQVPAQQSASARECDISGSSLQSDEFRVKEASARAQERADRRRKYSKALADQLAQDFSTNEGQDESILNITCFRPKARCARSCCLSPKARSSCRRPNTICLAGSSIHPDVTAGA
jgi:hypothetical protein